MSFEDLKKLNRHLMLKEIHEAEFAFYGKIIEGYDFSELISFTEDNIGIPEAGNCYVASVPELENLGIKNELENDFYGEMSIQIGYCNGQNSTLNGLEYHRCSEINIAVTDMILMLGKLQLVHNNQYDTENIEIFYVPKGTAIQLYETTLHFSPCKTSLSGFKCIVVLLKGTNTALNKDRSRSAESRLLFAKNKWLIAHPQRTPLIQKGAFPGIKGENTEILIA